MEKKNTKKERPLILAYYLPQFHPFKENDKWWGKGFTEWTNVGKAKALYPGHQQPKVPADLGYYDLRLPEIRQQQAELAKEAGIDGFCYWHYWFGGNGRQIMNEIIDEIKETKKPDFPFCLGWANESWKAKQWRKDGSGDILLMEQRYEGERDYRAHYEYVRELIKDDRYIRIDGKPFFLIYKPDLFPDVIKFMELWNNWIKNDNIAEEFYFVGGLYDNQYDKWCSCGFKGLTLPLYPKFDYAVEHMNFIGKYLLKIWRHLYILPILKSYKEMSNHMWEDDSEGRTAIIPYILPQWDHTPRSGCRGTVLYGSSPDAFYKQALLVLGNALKNNKRCVMVKSWNEWGEGNYMEPDLKWGKGYIMALRKAVDETFCKK